MKKINLLFIILLLLSNNSHGFSIIDDFVVTWEADNIVRCVDIEIDNMDNIYVLGHFLGKVYFDPTGATNFTESNDPNGETFLVKLNSYGSFLWVKTFPLMGSGIEMLNGDSNIYMTSWFKDIVNLDANETNQFHDSSQNIISVLHCIDTNGSCIWTQQTSEEFNSIAPWTLTSTPSGYLIETGRFNSNNNSNEWVGYIRKFDNFGESIWLKQMDGFYPTIATETDDNENIYLVGEIYADEGDIDIDFGEGVEIHSPLDFRECVLVIFNSNGDFMNSIAWQNENSLQILSLCIDENNNLVFSGYFEDTVDFDFTESEDIYCTSSGDLPSKYKAFLMRVDNEYNYESTIMLNVDHSIAVRSLQDQIFITRGYYTQDANFDIMNNNQMEEVDSSGRSGYIAAYSLTGELISYSTWNSEGRSESIFTNETMKIIGDYIYLVGVDANRNGYLRKFIIAGNNFDGSFSNSN